MSKLVERANLKGRRAIIVGGANGIGRAVTLALADEGVDIAVCDKNEAALNATAKEVLAAGRKVVAAVADVRKPDQLKAFYDKVAREFDSVQVLVNVAGGVLRKPFMETTPEQHQEDIRLNYGYVIDSIQYAVPLIRRGGTGGSIINFTTIEATRGAGTFAVYAGAKAGTVNLTRALAAEFGPERIRVNVIQPDTTPSEGNLNALGPEAGPALMKELPESVFAEAMKMYIPMEVPPTPEQLADAVVFLASDLSSSITGVSLPVDGGTSATAGFLNWPYGDGFMPAPMVGTLKRLFPS